MGKANTSLSALNEMLFEQLEKITNDDLSEEELHREITRTKMITDISNQIVNNAELELKAIKLKEDLIPNIPMPAVFGLPEYDK